MGSDRLREVGEQAREVKLRDGSCAWLRPIEPTDKDRLRTGFHRLSDQSRRRRFLVAANALSPEDLAYLTEVDHRRHEAIVALDAPDGELIGAARYVRVPGGRESAEVAVAVVDAWQGRGVATALLEELTDRAREQGLRRYTALVSRENDVVISVLERLGAARFGITDTGEVEFGIDFPAQGIGDRLRGALGAAASGQLELLTGIARRLAIWRRL